MPADKAVASATGGRPGPPGAPRRPARHLLDVASAIISRSRSWERRWRGMVSALRTIHIQLSLPFLLIHEAQQGCRDATYEPSRFPVAVPYPSPHRATPAYVVVTSSDLDTSRNKASVSGLSWISRLPFSTTFLSAPFRKSFQFWPWTTSSRAGRTTLSG